MFLFSLRLGKSKKLFAAYAAVCAVLAALCVTGLANTPGIGKPASGSESTVSEVKSTDVNSFLKELGLKAGKAEIKREQVVIPESFNSVYEEYNVLQKAAGMDLKPYRGKTVEKLTIELDGGDPRFAVLLLSQDKVVGGHLTSLEYGGKNYPLKSE